MCFAAPIKPILLREKQKIGPIWMNADSSRFRSAPSYYAVASSKPISALVDDRTASIYELGIHNLQLSPGGGSLPERERHFEAGLLDLRSRAGLYSENPHGVEITDGILYRAIVTIPSQVPVGTYSAETFLIDRANQAERSSPSQLATSRSTNPGSNVTFGSLRGVTVLLMALRRWVSRWPSAGPPRSLFADASKKRA